MISTLERNVLVNRYLQLNSFSIIKCHYYDYICPGFMLTKTPLLWSVTEHEVEADERSLTAFEVRKRIV